MMNTLEDIIKKKLLKRTLIQRLHCVPHGLSLPNSLIVAMGLPRKCQLKKTKSMVFLQVSGRSSAVDS